MSVCRVPQLSSAPDARRVAPGVCYRLWAAEEHAACWSATAPRFCKPISLRSRPIWRSRVSSRPPHGRLDYCPALSPESAQLGAIDGETSHRVGAMASFGAHPRLAAHDAGDTSSDSERPRASSQRCSTNGIRCAMR